MSDHLWIAAPSHASPATEQSLPAALLSEVDAHRHRRGPYTMAGTIMRAVVPVALARWPELASRHDIELLSVAPELRGSIRSTRETLTSLAVPAERTRFYSRLRTLRLAHGLTEFLADHLRRLDDGPRSLVVRNIDDADPTDAELLSVLLRRLDPALLTLVVRTGTKPVAEPLGAALAAYAVPVVWSGHTSVPTPQGSTAELAAVHVESDCTDDRPELVAAYERLPAAHRTALHDRRAHALRAMDEFSLRLGAIPLHAERGSDPAGAGALALQEGLDYCIDMGFYDATVNFGLRGRAVIDFATQVEAWWTFTTKLTTALAAMGRPAEAEELYAETIALSDKPAVHMQVAYATGMLYTRHFDADRKDHRRAKALLNQAIAFATVLFEGKERLFHTVFNRNGLALVETHLGNLPAALRLVTEGLALLDRELEPDEH
ncbi:MAG TPA: hypothetical protein VEO01_01475, partial [Pseudonocardiaceae bacterium]|nr:hypothetical protein [Pseudonocardiaceae bacterium]